jgi:ATP-dependent DNA ligase
MTITTSKYIYPPRPTQSVPRGETNFFATLGWKAQLKYNGSRCLVKHLPDNTIQLWNRHGERFRTYHLPEWLEEQITQTLRGLNFKADQLHILDGELIDQKHRSLKDTIALWDVIVENGEHLLGTTYQERYSRLEDFSTLEKYSFGEIPIGYRLNDNLLMPTFETDFEHLWDTVDKVNKPFDTPLLEGIVLKDPTGVLERGWKEINNSDWIIRSRVTTGRHLF